MYAQIDGKFLEKTESEAIKEALSNDSDDKNQLLYPELKDTIEEVNIDENKIEIVLTNGLGYFSISVPLDSKIIEDLLSVTLKKMNKIKALIEALK